MTALTDHPAFRRNADGTTSIDLAALADLERAEANEASFNRQMQKLRSMQKETQS